MNAQPKHSLDEMNQAFRDHVSEVLGLSFDSSTLFTSDGHRHYATPIGDRHAGKFWYQLWQAPYPHAKFGHYPTDGGIRSHEWQPERIPALSPDEVALLADQASAARRETELARGALANERRTEVYAEYAHAPAVTRAGDHGYLARKGIDAPPGDWKVVQHSFRRDAKNAFTGLVQEKRATPESALAIPLRRVDSDRFEGVQYIAGDGKKDFAYGLPVGGLCYVFGNQAAGRPIYLCEGAATAAVVHRLTGCMTVVALSATGFSRVGKDLRQVYGDEAQLVFCAERGGGHAQATEAAVKAGGQLCEPPWGAGDPGTDFDDYCRLYGDEASREALSRFVAPSPSSIPDQTSDALVAWIRRINNEFFVALEWGQGQTCIGKWTDSGPVAVDERTLRLALANRRMSGTKSPPHLTWLNHRHRKEFRRVAYDPARTVLDESVDLNLWTGFAVEPAPGDWGLLKTHIRENVCAGVATVDAHLLGWMAYIVQNLDRPSGVILVLRGAECAGKGVLLRALRALFGRHALTLNRTDQLAGTFTAHLEAKSLVILDEIGYANDHALSEAMKSLSTEDQFLVHPKGRTPYMAKNYLNFGMATNKSHVIRAGQDQRRYFVLDVVDRFADLRDADKATARAEYFKAISAQLEAGGHAAMLYDLLHMDLTGFHVAAFPRTAAVTRQVEMSLAGPDRYLVDYAREGWDAGHEVDKKVFYESYRIGDRHAVGPEQFWRRAREVLGDPLRHTQRVSKVGGGSRTRMVSLPDLATARQSIQRALGVEVTDDN